MNQICQIPIEFLGEKFNVESTEAIWLLSMVLGMFANFGVSLIQNPILRKLYSVAVSICFGFFLIGTTYFFILGLTVLIWLIMTILPRRLATKVGHFTNYTVLITTNLYCFWTNVGRRSIIFRDHLM